MEKTRRSFRFAWQVLVLLSVFNVGCGRRPRVIVRNTPQPVAAQTTAGAVAGPVTTTQAGTSSGTIPLADTTGVSGTSPLATDSGNVSATRTGALVGPVTASFENRGTPVASRGSWYEQWSEQYRSAQRPGYSYESYRYEYAYEETTTTSYGPLGELRPVTGELPVPQDPPAASTPALPTSNGSATGSATEPGLVPAGV